MPAGFPCPLRLYTGLDCPLCGATRATLALLRGDLERALDLNALYVLLLPLAAIVALTWVARGQPPALVRWPRLPAVLIAVAIAYAVVRNLPFAPFEYLGTVS